MVIRREDFLILPDVMGYLELKSDTHWEPDAVRREIQKYVDGETVEPVCLKAIEFAIRRLRG